jgi:ubiquinone biosynthesis protein
MSLILRIGWITLVVATMGAAAVPKLAYYWVRGKRHKLLEAVGILISRVAEALGPAALKLAQMASYRGDLLPGELIAPLIGTQDKVSPPSRRQVRRAIESAFGLRLQELFLQLDERPVASGSIAVVLRGRTVDNEDVAVKVVRPGVAARIQTDLQCLRWTVRIVSDWPRFRTVPIIDAFELIADLVTRQCDMQIEACSAARLKDMLRGEVIIPAPRMDLTRSGVLTMRYLKGASKISDPRIPRYQYQRACRMLLRALYRMIFEHGLVHCDLHPGNVSVTEDGRVILYDFGLTASLDTRTRLHFREFFQSVVRGDHVTAARILLDNARAHSSNVDVDAFREDLRVILVRRTGQRTSDFLVIGFVKELFELQYRHGVYGAAGFTSAIWALGTFEGLVRERYGDLDFQTESRHFMTSTIFEQLKLV